MQLYNNVVLTVIAACLIMLIYSAYYGQWQGNLYKYPGLAVV